MQVISYTILFSRINVHMMRRLAIEGLAIEPINYWVCTVCLWFGQNRLGDEDMDVGHGSERKRKEIRNAKLRGIKAETQREGLLAYSGSYEGFFFPLEKL